MDVKLEQFKKALTGFEYLVEQDFNTLGLDEKLVDGLQNGMIQKFEICTELCWKLLKHSLFANDGVDAKTPKMAVKEYYLAGHVSEDQYLILIEAINDRNKASHLYQEDEFNRILSQFPAYLSVFQFLLQKLG